MTANSGKFCLSSNLRLKDRLKGSLTNSANSWLNDSPVDRNVTTMKVHKLNEFNASWFMHINLWCKQSSE